MRTYEIFVQHNDQWHKFKRVDSVDFDHAMDFVRNVYRDKLEELTGGGIEYVNLDWEEVDV